MESVDGSDGKLGCKYRVSLQIATVVVFIMCVIAGFLFYRDLPDFKISMQGFMQSQKKWKCRECDHEWEI